MVRKSKKCIMEPDIYQTEDVNVRCTKLPEFIRAKMYLGGSFRVYFAQGYVAEGTRVSIQAGNSENPNGELKNNQSFVQNCVADFKDLRFLGKSGRGKKFNVYIVVKSEPENVIVYPDAIKVTVDGPRPPRNNKNKNEMLPMSPSDSQASTTTNAYLSLSKSIKKERKQQMINSKLVSIQKEWMSNLPLKKRYKFFFDDSVTSTTTHSVSPRSASTSSSLTSSSYASSNEIKDEDVESDMMYNQVYSNASSPQPSTPSSSLTYSPACSPQLPVFTQSHSQYANTSHSLSYLAGAAHSILANSGNYEYDLNAYLLYYTTNRQLFNFSKQN